MVEQFSFLQFGDSNMLYDKGDFIEARISRGAAAPFANGLSRGSQASQAESSLGSFFFTRVAIDGVKILEGMTG